MEWSWNYPFFLRVRVGNDLAGVTPAVNTTRPRRGNQATLDIFMWSFTREIVFFLSMSDGLSFFVIGWGNSFYFSYSRFAFPVVIVLFWSAIIVFEFEFFRSPFICISVWFLIFKWMYTLFFVVGLWPWTASASAGPVLGRNRNGFCEEHEDHNNYYCCCLWKNTPVLHVAVENTIAYFWEIRLWPQRCQPGLK